MQVPHLIVDAVCPRWNKKDIKEILLELCEIAEMHPISKAFTVDGVEYNPGVSGFLFIEFSNIAIHTFERDKRTACNIDLFSCKKFDVKKVMHYLRSKGLTEISKRRLWRSIKYDE